MSLSRGEQRALPSPSLEEGFQRLARARDAVAAGLPPSPRRPAASSGAGASHLAPAPAWRQAAARGTAAGSAAALRDGLGASGIGGALASLASLAALAGKRARERAIGAALAGGASRSVTINFSPNVKIDVSGGRGSAADTGDIERAVSRALERQAGKIHDLVMGVAQQRERADY